MLKGDSEHAATHAHGIQHRPEPPAPLTVEQRVSKLEQRVEQLEAGLAEKALAAGVGRGPQAVTDERRSKSRE